MELSINKFHNLEALSEFVIVFIQQGTGQDVREDSNFKSFILFA